MTVTTIDNLEAAIVQLPLGEQQQLFERLLNRLQRQAVETLRVNDAAANGQIDEQELRDLIAQWKRETEHLSSLKQVCLHPAYQRIIGLGMPVVPYLLRELEQSPDHWFWALRAITDADPAHDTDTFEDARQAWLTWGKEKGDL
ncbi:MAG TPA: hypothetical protein PLD20_04315 [Blastocatellia bacterium]|nr:hypothetical protein [Blastocatellia bacterium]HMX30142.1 hypothetical protein [Blastocatellia bacterium]HMZ17130.1 hypothetical protein [Blastocatellia bacterium]HNG32620.1 hypothetical protein [Blastocatellia bacterium]